MEISDWILGGLIGAAVTWLNYLGIRLRKIDGEAKNQTERIAWLHKRVEKLEHQLINDAGDRQVSDIFRSAHRETLSDQQPLNGS